MLTDHQRIALANGLTVDADDNLRLRVYNSGAGVTLRLEGRVVLDTGAVVPFSQDLTPATDRTASTVLVRLAPGVLLTATLRAIAGAPRRGQTWAIVELVRGFTGDTHPGAVLIQGYVSETTRRAFPGAPLEDSVDGRGVIRSITGTDPAAGAEFSETVPTNARWRLISVMAVLVADATVATRTPSLIIDDGTTQILRIGHAGTLTAGVTAGNQWFAGAGAAGSFGSFNTGLLPERLDLLGGYRIRTSTANLQAGDNYGAPQLLVEEWIED